MELAASHDLLLSCRTSRVENVEHLGQLSRVLPERIDHALQVSRWIHEHARTQGDAESSGIDVRVKAPDVAVANQASETRVADRSRQAHRRRQLLVRRPCILRGTQVSRAAALTETAHAERRRRRGRLRSGIA